MSLDVIFPVFRSPLKRIVDERVELWSFARIFYGAVNSFYLLCNNVYLRVQLWYFNLAAGDAVIQGVFRNDLQLNFRVLFIIFVLQLSRMCCLIFLLGPRKALSLLFEFSHFHFSRISLCECCDCLFWCKTGIRLRNNGPILDMIFPHVRARRWDDVVTECGTYELIWVCSFEWIELLNAFCRRWFLLFVVWIYVMLFVSGQ